MAGSDTRIGNRLMLALVGAAAGLSFWFLIDVLEDIIDNPQLYIFITATTLAFFGTALALAGPLALGRALVTAVLVAVPAALLMTWASLRFDTLDAFLSSVHPVFAFAVLVTIPLPFLIAQQRTDEGWRSYAALFDHSWNIVVRYSAAWLFVGVVWGVVFLSDALFRIVGLTIISDLLDINAVPYLLTGTVLGLAIAVVNELSDYVSPYLILQLLRLLLPVLVVVMAVFIVALPIRGLSGLFGGLSAAATLMSIVIGAVTLVTTAIDKSDTDAAQSPVMVWSARALSLMAPVVAVLAAYAIWLRVAQYGWTPDRIVAALIAGFVLAYAVAYALLVLRGAEWRARIRQVNIRLALLVVAVAVLWHTPILNSQRLSTNSQIARFQDGRTDVAALDVWAIGREWGKAGEVGLQRLAAMQDHPQAEALASKLARLTETGNRYEYEAESQIVAEGPARASLVSLIPVRPEGSDLPEAALADFGIGMTGQVRDGCERQTPAGNPGCVAVRAELLPHSAGAEYLIAYMTGDTSVQFLGVRTNTTGTYMMSYSPLDLARGELPTHEPDIIDALLRDDFSIAPAGINVIKVEDMEIFIQP